MKNVDTDTNVNSQTRPVGGVTDHVIHPTTMTPREGKAITASQDERVSRAADSGRPVK